jgi:pyrroline-5-carboxylate reductase
MTKVIIIGSGNVAQHLITAFQNAKIWELKSNWYKCIQGKGQYLTY